MSLDKTDLKILRLLQSDGRMTNQEMAIKCNISPSACHERFKRLRDEGYITGFSAILDPGKLDRAFIVYALVILNSTSSHASQEFSDAANKIAEITECFMVIGSFDYLVKIRVQDMNAYRIFLGSTLSQIPGVREVRSCAVIEQVKHTTDLPI